VQAARVVIGPRVAVLWREDDDEPVATDDDGGLPGSLRTLGEEGLHGTRGKVEGGACGFQRTIAGLRGAASPDSPISCRSAPKVAAEAQG